MAPPEHKRCLGCGYILDGLPEPRCPECGRGFDPLDSRTYRTGPHPPRWPIVLAIVGILCPWIVVGAIHATWLVAALELGRFPRPYADDPKSIGPATDVLYSATCGLFLVSPSSFLAFGIGVFGVALDRGRKRPARFVAAVLLCFVLSWLCSFGFLRSSRVANWFFD